MSYLKDFMIEQIKDSRDLYVKDLHALSEEQLKANPGGYPISDVNDCLNTDLTTLRSTNLKAEVQLFKGNKATVFNSFSKKDRNARNASDLTPPESTGPVVTFAKTNLAASDIPRKLRDGRVNVRLSTHWMRVSPAVYNDMRDIERFLDVL